MTATAFVPTGHPVRRFELAIAAIAIVCLALWWSAVLAPRLIIEVEQIDTGTREGVVVVTNDSPTAVDIGDVHLEAGATARISTEFPVECGADVELRVRTIFGVTRTVEAERPTTCRQ